MAWATFLRDSTKIDFFDPGEELKLDPEQETATEALTQEFDAALRETVRTASRVRRVDVQNQALPTVISVADQPFGNRVAFVGIALGAQALPNPSRERDDFDVLEYRGNYYFAGTTGFDELEELDGLVGRAIDEELQLGGTDAS
jgi:hypothetical protein